jgi:hypothetical protein
MKEKKGIDQQKQNFSRSREKFISTTCCIHETNKQTNKQETKQN